MNHDRAPASPGCDRVRRPGRVRKKINEHKKKEGRKEGRKERAVMYLPANSADLLIKKEQRRDGTKK